MNLPPDINKRKRRYQIPKPTSNDNEKFPRFLIISREGSDNFNKVSPFFIEKSIKHLIGEVKLVKKLKSGSLFVETISKVQTEKLLNCTLFNNDFPIKVEKHVTLNFCKGVIYFPDLDEITEDEILSELKPQNVIGVKRILLGRGDRTKKTHLYTLTFDQVDLPETIKIGYQKLRIRPYVAAPLRCFNCLSFGHTNQTCSKKPVCAKCASERHEDPCTTFILKCVNCGQKHSSLDRSCPKYIEEKEIKKIQVTNKITYSEAKKVYKEKYPIFNKTFAQVTAMNLNQKQTKEAACQTDENNEFSYELGKKISPLHTKTDIATCMDTEQIPFVGAHLPSLTPPPPTPSSSTPSPSINPLHNTPDIPKPPRNPSPSQKPPRKPSPFQKPPNPDTPSERAESPPVTPGSTSPPFTPTKTKRARNKNKVTNVHLPLQ